jgi:hypothetical protein
VGKEIYGDNDQVGEEEKDQHQDPEEPFFVGSHGAEG